MQYLLWNKIIPAIFLSFHLYWVFQLRDGINNLTMMKKDFHLVSILASTVLTLILHITRFFYSATVLW